MPIIAAVALVIVGTIAFSVIGNGKNVSASSEVIESGLSGFCLDVYHGQNSAGSKVDTASCNGSAAQDWLVTPTHITHGGNYCLDISGSGQTANDGAVINKCSDNPGQVWLRDKSGYFNPYSRLCLVAPGGQTNTQAVLGSCNYLKFAYAQWSPYYAESNKPAGEENCGQLQSGERLACNAVKEWTTWQSDTQKHNDLLTTYTDGSPYEQWCADFISYVYKESGYPFKNGETNGWDENNANYIQNQGFSLHNADSGYLPKPGDVAYFNYNGGHTEIVIAGGQHPSFVYGDSATKDPATGNGQMMANSITQDGEEGQLVYYLSPNL